MTLFERVKQDPLLQDTHAFVPLLLHRLSISEVIAASKFKQPITAEADQDQQAPQNIRETCRRLNYSEQRTETIASIFKEIVTLAKLIQTAWRIQSNDRSERVVKQEAIVLAQAITSVKITPENILRSVKASATTLTDQLLECLNTPENIMQLDHVTVILKECFPQIDVPKLEAAVLRMMSGIGALKSAEEELHNTVLIDRSDAGEALSPPKVLIEHSLFKSAEQNHSNPSTAEQHTTRESWCAIS